MSMSEWDGSNKPSNAREAGSGWEFAANPMSYLPDYFKWKMSQNKATGTTTYTAPQMHGFSAGGGAYQGGYAPTATSGSTETLASIPQGTSTAGLVGTPATYGLGSGTAGSMTIANGAAGWGTYAKAGLSAMSAYQNAKQNAAAAKASGQSQTQTRTPYMSSMLNPFIPYILNEALSIYARRQKNVAGRDVGNYNPLQAILGQFFNSYTNGNR